MVERELGNLQNCEFQAPTQTLCTFGEGGYHHFPTLRVLAFWQVWILMPTTT